MSNPKRKWNAVQSADGPARRTRSRTIRQADFVNVANTPSNDDPPATNDAQMDQQSESSSVEQVQAAEGKGKGKEKETSPGMPSPEWVIEEMDKLIPSVNMDNIDDFLNMTPEREAQIRQAFFQGTNEVMQRWLSFQG